MRVKRITNPLADKPRRRNSNYVEMQRLKRLSGRCFGQQIRCWSKKRGTSPKKKAVSATTEHLQVLPGTSQVCNEEHAQEANFDDTVQENLVAEDNFKSFLSDVNQLLMRSVEDSFPLKKRGKKKADNISPIYEAWTERRQSVHDRLISFQSPDNDCFCESCGIELDVIISCSTCVKMLCETCDDKFHFEHPFHSRWMWKDTCYMYMPCTTYVANRIQKDRRVPIPLYAPKRCQCSASGTMRRVPGNYSAVVIMLKGRFDLHTTGFQCSICSLTVQASAEQYVVSNFWPGNVGQQVPTFFVHTEVLQKWFFIKHEAPGTSEQKFLEILGHIARNENRESIINQPLFNVASKEYEYYHFCVEKKLKQKEKSSCAACGDSPLAVHVDGNFKLYRYADSSTKNPPSLLEPVIKADMEVSHHVDLLNSVDPPKKKKKDESSCGDTQYKAARNTTSKFKNLDETGLLMASCRHGCILYAANMFSGENFRYIHYMQHQAHIRKVSFFCYDVVCRFWPFSERISSKIPEFEDLTVGMVPFLSRMHGKTHVMSCQLANTGHWKKGSALTSGEEQEQSNAKMSRYVNTSKYMNKTARNDHLSFGIWHWNELKIGKMPRYLTSRLHFASEMEKEYRAQVDTSLLEKEDDEVYRLAKQLSQEYSDLQVKRPRKDALVQAENELESLHYALEELKKRTAKTADGSKARNALRVQESVIVERSKELMTRINNDQSVYQITSKNFHDAQFPWLPLKKSKSFVARFNTINTWMLWKRSQEEMIQVRKEMKQFLNSQLDRRVNLKRTDAELRSKLESVEDGSTEARLLRGSRSIVTSEFYRLTSDISKAIDEFQESLDMNTTEMDEIYQEIDEDICDGIEEETEQLLMDYISH